MMVVRSYRNYRHILLPTERAVKRKVSAAIVFWFRENLA
jgi:hypothetical protein